MTKSAQRAIDPRNDILELLKTLTPAKLEELDRRARFITRPDGYPAGRNTTRSTDISRPTEQAAIHNLDNDQPQADPVGDQIRLLFATLAEAAGVLNPATRWLRYLDNYGDQAIVRETSLAGDCKACTRPVAGGHRDPIRNGYCEACNSAYRRWTHKHPIAGDPGAHRLAFETERRATTATRPTPLDTACRHACCDRTHEHDHWHQPDTCPDCHATTNQAAS